MTTGLTVEVVAEGIAFPEGPAHCADGTIVLVAVGAGTVVRVWPASGTSEVLADTGGGPNAAQITDDGGAVVTQNGGVDFTGRAEAASFPPCRPVPPGIQSVSSDGAVVDVWTDGALAPNDLVVAPDGTLWFTDPGPVPPVRGRTIGRVLALARGESKPTVVAGGFEFCNGIALTPDGEVVVVEGRGLQRVSSDGDKEWIVESVGPGGADGFAVDVDGRFYVAAARDHVIRVLDVDGRPLDVIELPGAGFTTNCCFGGDDLRTLFVTDGLPGRLLAVEGMPFPGLPQTPWKPPII